MKANIYYFSGTGNSLAVARDLAKDLDDADPYSHPTGNAPAGDYG